MPTLSEGYDNVVHSSGELEAWLEASYNISMNTSTGYSIEGLRDDILDLASRTWPKGWVYVVVVPQWI